MREISYLKIKESHIPIEAYRSILDNYTSFLKFFYGNNIDLFIDKGSQILKVVKSKEEPLDTTITIDFYEKLMGKIFNKKSYREYQKPINHLYKISDIKEKYKLQDLDLFFNENNIFINKQLHEKLAEYDKADLKEITSIIGTIHLITDKDGKLRIKVTDSEDCKEIKGLINTGDKEKDKQIFEEIRLNLFSKRALISGCLYRNQITFSKKSIDISHVREIEETNDSLERFRGIFSE